MLSATTNIVPLLLLHQWSRWTGQDGLGAARLVGLPTLFWRIPFSVGWGVILAADGHIARPSSRPAHNRHCDGNAFSVATRLFEGFRVSECAGGDLDAV